MIRRSGLISMSAVGAMVLGSIAALGAVYTTHDGFLKFTYDHEGEDLISITYPEGWIIDTEYVADAKAAGTYEGGEPEIRVVEAMPEDGTKLWIGIWTAPRVESLEEGLEYAASLDGSLFTDIEATEPEARQIGGMDARTFRGTAKRQGEDVEFAAALVEPKEGVIVEILYVGVPNTWENHEDELNAIVESIRPAGD